jgi:hypothetical protein
MQLWLHKRASMLRDTNMDCVVMVRVVMVRVVMVRVFMVRVVMVRVVMVRVVMVRVVMVRVVMVRFHPNDCVFQTSLLHISQGISVVVYWTLTIV